MDRISESLLNEFSNDHGIPHLREDRRFEHFASFITVRRHYNGSFDSGDIVTAPGDEKSGDDTGIDGIAIIVNGSLVTDVDEVADLVGRVDHLDVTFIFVQAERSPNFDTAKIGQFGFGVLDFFKDVPSLKRNDKVTHAASVMAALYEKSGMFRRGIPICRLYYVTTGTWVGDQNLEARKQAVIADIKATNLFREVEFIPVGAERIQKLYREAKNAISTNFKFERKAVLPSVAGVSQAYLGIIPATEFFKIISDETGKIIGGLFYDNVRDWQGYNPVNTEIQRTLQSDPRSSLVLWFQPGMTSTSRTTRS